MKLARMLCGDFEVDYHQLHCRVQVEPQPDGTLRCIMSCDSTDSEQLEPLVGLTGGTLLDQNDGIKLYLSLPVLENDLRATLAHYRLLFNGNGLRLRPETRYRYVTEDDESHEILFLEFTDEPLYVSVSLPSLYEPQMVKWRAKAEASGLLAHSEHFDYIVVVGYKLLLVADAYAEAERLATYLKLAQLFAEVVDEERDSLN